MAPTEETPTFIKGLEKIKEEKSPLTPEQEREQNRIIELLKQEYEAQKDIQANKAILRKRNRFVHLHGALGGERTVDVVLAMKGQEMAEHGLHVAILNLNFLKRLQTRALYVFLKDVLLKDNEAAQKIVFLKIQEEDADDIDRREMLEFFQDKSEDAPLFIITDETCKEAERIDEVVADLTKPEVRFHFWSSSAYAHGTPEKSQRFRLAAKNEIPPPIKQVMDMIDIEDDDVDITGPHHVPLRRVIFPAKKDESETEYNIHEHLAEQRVCLISHSRKHTERDVWECEDCGKILARYLKMDLQIDKPGLSHKDVFIVGSIQRFESSVSVSGLQVALLDKDIVSEVLFCRRAVKIQDILQTMNKVVVSDSVSMRGVDKKVVIVIPSARQAAMQDRITRDPKKKEEHQKKRQEEKKLNSKERLLKLCLIEDFWRPVPICDEDEEVFYRRPQLSSDPADDVDIYLRPDLHMPKPKAEGEQCSDTEDSESFSSTDSSDSDKDSPDVDRDSRSKDYEPYRKRYTAAAHQSLLRRAINSLEKADKDMVLDLFMDAPQHAILFHFAEDDFQIE